MPPDRPPPERIAARARRLSLLNGLFEFRALIALAVLIVLFGMLTDSFLTVPNLIRAAEQIAVNGVVALGMLLVILRGGIDLSVGSVIGLSGVVAGELLAGLDLRFVDMIAYPPVWGVVVLCVAVGMLVGLVNGVLVTRFEVAPFIATFGMLYVARGLAMLISGGSTYTDLDGSPQLGNTGFGLLGDARPLGIPISIWIMVALAVAVMLALTRTPFGRWLYAAGGNERAAELSGVPVNRVKTVVYVISGACAALAGLLIASELTVATPQAGETFELNAIAAVILGGATLNGGRGTVRGTLVGVLVVALLVNGLMILDVSLFWQILIKGALIIFVVMLDQGRRRLQRHRSALSALASDGRPD
ncbi:ABC transporter permease [Streptosporangium amethystogenes subsp. fukuiense]|uniref:ABC transporter permease n=1 Tax=Streptosporangium amethystogenes subsp. fukuiense TaxID=698418 RepID=A0ABW2T4E2_9ACTN